jgi:hypothetical protein
MIKAEDIDLTLGLEEIEALEFEEPHRVTRERSKISRILRLLWE